MFIKTTNSKKNIKIYDLKFTHFPVCHIMMKILFEFMTFLIANIL